MAGLPNRPDLWFEALARWARRTCGWDQSRGEVIAGVLLLTIPAIVGFYVSVASRTFAGRRFDW